jgi:hypothetical protein
MLPPRLHSGTLAAEVFVSPSKVRDIHWRRPVSFAPQAPTADSGFAMRPHCTAELSRARLAASVGRIQIYGLRVLRGYASAARRRNRSF